MMWRCLSKITTASARTHRQQAVVAALPTATTLRTVTTDTVASGLSPAPAIFTEEHLEMQRSVRRIIDEDINPFVSEWEAEGQYPVHSIFKKLGSAGFLCMTREPEYGGAGLDFSHQMAVAEELGNIKCGAIPMSIQVQDMATPALAKYGSSQLKEQFLAPSIAGDFVACLGVSEVQAGSDVAAVTTFAAKDGDDYVINGGKMWTTNGKNADWMCLLANTCSAEETGSPYNNKTLICVPMDTPGLSTSPRLDKLGMRSSDTCQVFLDNVRVPQSNRIGTEGQGFIYQMQQFQEERMIISAAMVRQLESVVEECARYTSDRRIFGKPILAHQTVQFRLAELQTEIEAFRALVYRCTEMYAQGRDVTHLASMAKLKGGRLAREVTDSCLQFYGGMGFMNETVVSRMYRDLRLMSIGGGADEVMLGILTKTMADDFAKRGIIH